MGFAADVQCSLQPVFRLPESAAKYKAQAIALLCGVRILKTKNAGAHVPSGGRVLPLPQVATPQGEQ
ncbi:MAG: hypothetical protein Kow0032_11940 [Methyloligellaceae bacterium]